MQVSKLAFLQLLAHSVKSNKKAELPFQESVHLEEARLDEVYQSKCVHPALNQVFVSAGGLEA